jgi:hypothetical protein
MRRREFITHCTLPIGLEALDALKANVGERPNLLAVDRDSPHQFVLLEHRDREQCDALSNEDAATSCWRDGSAVRRPEVFILSF